jgi:hypothetical protein
LLELWAGAFLGCLYVLWGVVAARRTAQYV